MSMSRQEPEEIAEIRRAVRGLCDGFPGEYWRAKDGSREYPAEFVDALAAADPTVAVDTVFSPAGCPLGAGVDEAEDCPDHASLVAEVVDSDIVVLLVGEAERGQQLLGAMRARLDAIAAAGRALPRRPRVFFEEWDEPPISAIRWVSELLAIAGGDDIFPDLSRQSLGKDRIVREPVEIIRRRPEMVLGSWCGKKFRPERVAARPGWEAVPAVRDGQLFEIKSADILQPGPAALTDGVERMHRLILDWSARHG